MTFVRTQNRAVNELRPVKLTRNFTVHAEGSVLVEFGDTRVLCTASVEETRAAVPQAARARAGSRPNTACCRAPRTRAPTARPRAASRAGARRRSSA